MSRINNGKETTMSNLKNELKSVLYGIDLDDSTPSRNPKFYTDAWFETSSGVEFGKKVLSNIMSIAETHESKMTEMYEMLDHLLKHDCINDCSLDREVETLLAKARGEQQ